MRPKSMKIFGDLLWLSSGRIFAAVLQAVTLVLVARNAGPADFGIVTAFLGVAVVMQTFFDFGFSTYITRVRATSPLAPEVNWSLRLFKFLGLLLAIILIPTGILFSSRDHTSWWWLVPLAIALVVERQADIRLAVAIADGDVWKNTAQIVLRRTITVAALFICLSLEVGPVLSFGLSALFAALISLVASYRLIRIEPQKEKMRASDGISILKSARSFWANSLGSQIRNLDVLVVASVGLVTTAGLYGAITKASNPLLMFSSSLSAILLPIVSKLGTRSLKPILGPLLAVVVPMAMIYITMAIFADELIGLVFGAGYADAAGGFRILLVGLIFAALVSIQVAVLQAWGFEQVVGRISIIISVLGLTAIGTGAAWWGVTGAASGLAGSHFFQFVLLLYVARSKPRQNGQRGYGMAPKARRSRQSS